MKIKIEINYHVDDNTFNEVLHEAGLNEEKLKMILQQTYLEQVKIQNMEAYQAELNVKFEEDDDEFGNIQVGYA